MVIVGLVCDQLAARWKSMGKVRSPLCCSWPGSPEVKKEGRSRLMSTGGAVQVAPPVPTSEKRLRGHSALR